MGGRVRQISTALPLNTKYRGSLYAHVQPEWSLSTETYEVTLFCLIFAKHEFQRWPRMSSATLKKKKKKKEKEKKIKKTKRTQNQQACARSLQITPFSTHV